MIFYGNKFFKAISKNFKNYKQEKHAKMHSIFIKDFDLPDC